MAVNVPNNENTENIIDKITSDFHPIDWIAKNEI